MLNRDKYLLFLLVFLVGNFAFSQTKEDLKKQKSVLEKEINYTTDLLNKTKSNKTKSLNYLKVLETQIISKEQLLITLNIEISLLNKQISKTERAILSTEKSILEEEQNLADLKEEYAKIIYASYKQKGRRNNLMFIVSSEDFNQAYKRILYLKQYSTFRKNQAQKITESQEELLENKERLAQQKEKLIDESATKVYLVSSKKEELQSINYKKNEKQELVNKLSKSERVFRKQLNEKQKKAKELNDRIRKIIEEEIRKAAEIAKKNNKDDSFALTPEALALSSDFANNKGKLPWPLEKGVIISRYGKQKHAIFAGVETFNNGVDIATDHNSTVRAIFEGKVSRIFFIKGQGKAVLINHGEYFSVYSGLKEVSVKTGDKLFSKEKIGVVFTQEQENKTELHFEIWKGYEKHDPSHWLFKAY